MTGTEKWTVWTGSALTIASGLAYFGVKYGMEPSDPWAVINHPSQPLLLKSHILVAPLLVFGLGMIAIRHIWRHFRGNQQLGRKSGVTTALSLIPMILTGYLIQSVTEPGLLAVTTWTHIGSSALFTVGIAAHTIVILRRLDRARTPQRS